MLPLIPNSFGDIVTAANLVWSIYNALRESKGAAEDYQCLIQELGSFHHALNFVYLVVSKMPREETVARCIIAEITLCLTFLRAFHDSIEGYRKKLGSGSASSSWHTSSWHKIGWSVLKQKDISDIRGKISRHQQTIELYLNGVGISLNSDIKKSLVIIQTTLAEIRRAQEDLPQPIGYGPANSLTLITALGTELTLPIEHCYTPESGYELVEAHNYVISRNYGASVVNAGPDKWRLIMTKGARVVMSVVINLCPKCGRTNAGVMRDDGWYQCRRCDRRFICPDQTTNKQFQYKNSDMADFRSIFVERLWTKALRRRINFRPTFDNSSEKY
ncbi:hypothetical protein HYPSUDRAFT_1025921 [Hypholoma sublateritium FD-334 SS-4]|uniref:Uncharacterized protein n=1 Tax=Hypholoma sublateritium (strain FD-334 SS-4) TaxID=945553 RepID=A0A0D2PAC9_HYPSF|nr:hypothetical protein HYPSUDRAFT_1025921 [Hypholoma sublateritium FD-334 SS-4]